MGSVRPYMRNVRMHRNMRLRDIAAGRGLRAKNLSAPKEYPLARGDCWLVLVR